MRGPLFRGVEMNGRLRRFTEQHLERRYLGIPLDQRRHGAEAIESLGVQGPHDRQDTRAVVVDAQHAPIIEFTHGVPSEMDLADGGRGQRREIGTRVPGVVAGAHIDVVDVEQDTAPGAPGDCGEELPLRKGGVLVAQIGRGVFDQDAAPQMRLRSIHVATDDVERFFGQRQRQKITEVGATHEPPREVLRYEPRLEALYHAPDAVQMCRVEILRTAERESDAVQRERIIAADGVEIRECRAAAHVVLRVYLEPRYIGPGIDDGMMMLKAQPDPGRRRDRVAIGTRRCASRGQASLRLQLAVVFPPWIFEQSPAGSRTKDLGSRAWVAWPAQECAPSAQSFLATALMP